MSSANCKEVLVSMSMLVTVLVDHALDAATPPHIGGLVKCGCSGAPDYNESHAARQKEPPMTETTGQLIYVVPGVSCDHCRTAITAEVEKVAGVTVVDVDLDAKQVRVDGTQLDDVAIRAAIDEAGYDVA